MKLILSSEEVYTYLIEALNNKGLSPNHIEIEYNSYQNSKILFRKISDQKTKRRMSCITKIKSGYYVRLSTHPNKDLRYKVFYEKDYLNPLEAATEWRDEVIKSGIIKSAGRPKKCNEIKMKINTLYNSL